MKWLVYSINGGYWYQHTGQVPEGALDLYFGSMTDIREYEERNSLHWMFTTPPPKDYSDWLSE